MMSRLSLGPTIAYTIDTTGKETAVQLDTLLVKVASRCNINCTYCYVYNMGDEGWKDMPKLISMETVEALAKAVGRLAEQQTKAFATVLHGGEPLMLGPKRLEFVLASLRRNLPPSFPICIQTNGMLLTHKIADICSEYRVSISVSVDGPKDVNDQFRLGTTGEGTYEKVLEGLNVLRQHSDTAFLYAGLLAVIDPYSDPAQVYAHFKSLGTPSVDFLYRDGNHSNMPYGKRAFESVEYGSWLTKLLDIYLADLTPPRVRFLDDVIRLVLGGHGVKEGLGEMSYGIAIVETDGSITKNDTLKSTFEGADRFIEFWSVHTHELSQVFRTAEFAEYHALQRPSSSECQSCPYLKVCGGGMPLHRWKNGGNYNNPSVYCNDQKTVISAVISRLKKKGISVDHLLEVYPSREAVPL